MRAKRIIALLCIMAMLCSVFTVSASAVNNTDVDFTITMSNASTRYANSETAQRVKIDDSSSYINYSTRTNNSAATGPYQFEAFIYGAHYKNDSYVDCSSYTHTGHQRSKAIVTRGSVGLIHQDVYEKFADRYNNFMPYGQIWGKMVNNLFGSARGCWSVDSVGTYPYYNDVL